MAINIPKKDDKIRSELIDLVRIVAWQQYKVDNSNSDAKGLALYEQFKTEWELEDIHKMTTTKVQKFITDLGYSVEELRENAREYHEMQKAFKINTEVLVKNEDF